ncbi:hypothetical protein TWF970_008881 [Orbilia oligospora]|uniref:Peptidase S8/S53 domain-containing protein n=1 Tax=Orbilia oligospora TaxID=2813651 RepID=A0A7C8V9L4_ORBOL|nr:hypothetical protein TWF970_008881 [Orbilia oligospora]
MQTLIFNILFVFIFQLSVLRDPSVKAVRPSQPPVLNDKFPKIETWEKQSGEYEFVIRPPSELLGSGFSNKRMVLELAKTFLKEIEPYTLPPRKHAVLAVRSKYLGTFLYNVKFPTTLAGEEMREILGIIRRYRNIRRYNQNFENLHPQYSRSYDIDADDIHVPSHELPDYNYTDIPTSCTYTTSNSTYQNRQKPSSKVLHKRGDEPGRGGMSPEIERPDLQYEDMIKFSLPPGIEFNGEKPWRAWRWKNASEGVKMYYLDTGCDLSHAEFEGVELEWLYPNRDGLDEPGESPGYFYHDKSTIFAHGTTTLSKILGKSIGVAPKVDVTLVRLEMTIYGRSISGSVMVNAMMMTYDHIVENRAKMKKPCVVVSSTAMILWDKESPINRYICKLWITSLRKMGCYVVVAAGNEQEVNDQGFIPLTTYPQLLAGDPEVDINLLVVGGHNDEGFNRFAFNKFVSISAQAWKVVAVKAYLPGDGPPDGDWSGSYQYFQGTSYSTPVVAGLLATFISQGYKYPLDYLLAIAKDPMKPGEPKRAFNGIWPDLWPTARRPENYKRPPLKNPGVAEKWAAGDDNQRGIYRYKYPKTPTHSEADSIKNSLA